MRMEMKRNCGVKEKETSEPLVPQNPTPPEPRVIQKPLSPFHHCLKQPETCIAIGAILVLLFTVGAWVVSGQVIQQLEGISNVLEGWKPNSTTGERPLGPSVSTPPPITSATGVTRKRQTTTANALKADGYYTIENEGNGTTSIQKSCENCTKVFFTKAQLEEIANFIHSCHFDEKGCNVAPYRATKGYCAMCDTVVAMSKSPLNFCVDVDSQLGSAFIRSYILYHDVLNSLYTFYHTVINT